MTGFKETGRPATPRPRRARPGSGPTVCPTDEVVQAGGNDSWANLADAAAALRVPRPRPRPGRDRRLPRGPEPGHRHRRGPGGLAGAGDDVADHRAGRRCPTSPRRRSAWPSGGSSATSGCTASASAGRRGAGRQGRASLRGRPFGGGVIGNTAGSGPVIGGSSPPPRALMTADAPSGRSVGSVTIVRPDGHPAPSSSGLGHHPLKVETRVRIPLGLPGFALVIRLGSAL